MMARKIENSIDQCQCQERQLSVSPLSSFSSSSSRTEEEKKRKNELQRGEVVCLQSADEEEAVGLKKVVIQMCNNND